MQTAYDCTKAPAAAAPAAVVAPVAPATPLQIDSGEETTQPDSPEFQSGVKREEVTSSDCVVASPRHFCSADVH